MKTVLFHSNQLGMRGTEVALYDYALYNEIILGNKSIIVSDSTKELSTLDKFKSKFEVLLYEEPLLQPVWIPTERLSLVLLVGRR